VPANSDIQNLINSADIGAVILECSSRVKLFTARARDVLHLVPTDLGRPLSDVHTLLVDVDLQADVKRVLDRLECVEREVQTRDGRWHLMRVAPYRTDGDGVDGAILTFVDITERRRTEQALRESEERMRLLVDSARDYAIITLDPGGRISNWNAGAARMFGYTDEEALGQLGELIFTPEDRARRAFAQELEAARERGRATDERWHMRKDGSRLFLSGILSPLRDAAGLIVGYVKIARDLTERKQWEEALQRSHDELDARVAERTRELERANATLDQQLLERRQAEDRVRRLLNRLMTVQEDERRRIARNLHDHFGQQLTALRLKLESLDSWTDRDSPLRERVEDIQGIATQFDRDLDFFTWELRPAALDDIGLVAAVSTFVQEWSKNYGIPAEFHSEGLGIGSLPFEIETHVYRVAQEALNNVLKHAQAQRVSVILERRANDVVLIIEDDGTGFVFDESAGAARDDKRLGLIGMQERAVLAGGTLEIETAPGEGTTVFLRVPIPTPAES
jgi:PAS domain S-box-containing protein